MWRSKERLEYWLSNSDEFSKQPPVLTIRNRLTRKLHSVQYTCTVKSKHLELDAHPVSFDSALPLESRVQDGLRMLGLPPQTSIDKSRKAAEIPVCVHPINLSISSTVKNIFKVDEKALNIKNLKMIISPYIRSYMANIKPIAVHEFRSLFKTPACIIAGNNFFISIPAIGIHKEKIDNIPYRMETLDINKMKPQEIRSFKHEAEVLKNLTEDRAELIAFFTHVPIEMISWLRYLDQEKSIIYSIANTPKRTNTRLHDMAVMQDIVSREIHLVLHRTQFRTVTLFQGVI
jgi:hypothetical protein